MFLSLLGLRLYTQLFISHFLGNHVLSRISLLIIFNSKVECTINFYRDFLDLFGITYFKEKAMQF